MPDSFPAEVCSCGARRIDSQLGLEPTPEQYVANLVAVFREVRRVLRKDGTCWVNLGDCYNSATSAKRKPSPDVQHGYWEIGGSMGDERVNVPGLAAKQLVGIPWRVAFALQADGWWLRSDIIWAKPNPMPESVTDRPTRAHEYLFLLTKSARYFWDADAIREASLDPEDDLRRMRGDRSKTYSQEAQEQRKAGIFRGGEPSLDRLMAGRNRRSVWEITTQPYPEAHFATFPTKLVEPCILAGSRPSWAMVEPALVKSPLAERIGDDPSLVTGRAGYNRPRHPDEGTRPITQQEQAGYAKQLRVSPNRTAMEREAGEAFAHYIRTDSSGARPIPANLLERWIDRGWLWREIHPRLLPADPTTSVVLDPFCGSGTTGVVCLRHDRSFIGIELNPAYCELARNRIRDDAPLLNHGLEAVA